MGRLLSLLLMPAMKFRQRLLVIPLGVNRPATPRPGGEKNFLSTYTKKRKAKKEKGKIWHTFFDNFFFC